MNLIDMKLEIELERELGMELGDEELQDFLDFYRVRYNEILVDRHMASVNRQLPKNYPAYCYYCDRHYERYHFRDHLNTQKHMRNKHIPFSSADQATPVT